jgi:hypothetical protein
VPPSRLVWRYASSVVPPEARVKMVSNATYIIPAIWRMTAEIYVAAAGVAVAGATNTMRRASTWISPFKLMFVTP